MLVVYASSESSRVSVLPSSQLRPPSLTRNFFLRFFFSSAALGVNFSPYMEATMTLALKNLTFFFHDEVRQSAAM